MDWAKAFLAALRKSGNVSQSARDAKISRQTAYDRRESDPDFKAAWDDVIAEAMDSLEAEAIKRAKKGSDTLLIFLLKSHRPEVYRDTVRQEHGGINGKPIQAVTANVNVDSINDTERAKDILAILVESGAFAPEHPESHNAETE